MRRTQTVAQLHAEVALGALTDAGLTRADVDGYFCSGDAPGPGPASMAEYMNLQASPRRVRPNLAARPTSRSPRTPPRRSRRQMRRGADHARRPAAQRRHGDRHRAAGARDPNQPEAPWEAPYAITTANGYAMCAMRHMYEYGTTSEQLAWVKVAASHHAQHNPHAMLPEVVTVADVVNSPMIADPLHRLDCCVISDGGGALVIVRPEIAKSLKRPLVKIIGAGEAVKHLTGGTLRSHHLGRGARPARSRSPKPASRRPTSNTPRSTTASPSPSSSSSKISAFAPKARAANSSPTAT